MSTWGFVPGGHLILHMEVLVWRFPTIGFSRYAYTLGAATELPNLPLLPRDGVGMSCSRPALCVVELEINSQILIIPDLHDIPGGLVETMLVRLVKGWKYRPIYQSTTSTYPY